MNKIKSIFNKKYNLLWPVLLMAVLVYGCTTNKKNNNKIINTFPGWAIGPFKRINSANPILTPDKKIKFMDPIRKADVLWEGKHTFNPAAVVRNDTIFLLYRAEDFIGKYKGTSRIGLAWSTNGITFNRLDHPVLYPDNDPQKKYEWEGGTEDPRVVQDSSGIFYMTYTAYDGTTARLCEATSKNLHEWTKHGPVFAKAYHGKYINLWSKSGAIVTKKEGDRMVAKKINGKYWMYWGDSDIYLATSKNLTDWKPVQNSNGKLMPVLKPRKNHFDSGLVESGPPAMITPKGILLIYNSMNAPDSGDVHIPVGTYSAGQALFSKANPKQLLKRMKTDFFHPEKSYEIKGQVNNVTFLEGLAPFKKKWYLYYGAADSTVCVAIYNPKS